jgi:hypothetical protein
MRSLIAVVAGLFIAFITEIIVVKIISIFLMPRGLNINDSEAMKVYILNAPVTVLFSIMLGNAIAAFLGAWTARRISYSVRNGLTVTIIFLTICSINYISYPYPSWALFGGAVFILLGGYIGTRLFQRNNNV